MSHDVSRNVFLPIAISGGVDIPKLLEYNLLRQMSSYRRA